MNLKNILQTVYLYLKKMFDLVTALKELRQGTLYIEFVVHTIRGEESKYDLLVHEWK